MEMVDAAVVLLLGRRLLRAGPGQCGKLGKARHLKRREGFGKEFHGVAAALLQGMLKKQKNPLKKTITNRRRCVPVVH